MLLLAALVHFGIRNIKIKHEENGKHVENAVKGDYNVPETPKPAHKSFDNDIRDDTSCTISETSQVVHDELGSIVNVASAISVCHYLHIGPVSMLYVYILQLNCENFIIKVILLFAVCFLTILRA